MMAWASLALASYTWVPAAAPLVRLVPLAVAPPEMTGAVLSTVTLLPEIAETLPEASTAYAW